MKLHLIPILVLLLFSNTVLSVDTDGDGSDAVEEALAGTSDADPTMRPFWWRTFNGDNADDRLGKSVSGAGDVNNDGYVDFIAGANGSGSGSARVYSGLDGSVLYTVNADDAGDSLGYSVSGAGDVNNDGYADFIAGASGDDNNGSNSGSARLYSGFDGSVLYTVNGGVGDGLGVSVSGAGDVNNDGYADFMAGSLGDNNNGGISGSARVYSGFDGSLLYKVTGIGEDYFGRSVSDAGDVNNDGYADFMAGAYGSYSGSAWVYSGLDGNVLYTVNGDSAGDFLGYSVSDSGDVNNDGFADFIVGAFAAANNGSASGSARVYSGIDGSVLYTVSGDSGGDRLGVSVSGAGDVNNDGYVDFMAGAYGNDDSGSVRVYSGFDGSVLYTVYGDSIDDEMGQSISGVGDLDGDGYADFIAGIHLDDNNGTDSGSVRIFLSSDLRNDIDTDFILNSTDTDDDGDGLPDLWENAFGLDPLDATGVNGANADPDADGRSNLTEYQDGTNPFVFNDDGDGSNGYEESLAGTSNIDPNMRPYWWRTFNGDSVSDQLGHSVSGAGDVNNDGYADFLAGAYLDDNNGSSSGSARVYSGVDGTVLYTVNGDSAGDYLGYSVSGAGDVNNDGYADFIAGAYADDSNGTNSGSARVYSGLDGSVLYTVNGDSTGDTLGRSVSGAGDVNNDGFADFMAGAWQDDNNGSRSGSARVYSGLDGSVLYTVNGDSADDYLGYSVSGAGDVNNDGSADFIVGAYGDDNNGSFSGSARVYSGFDGSVLYTVNGDSASDYLGYSVSGAGDVNNDGYADFMAGAHGDDNNGQSSGSARVFSGVDGSVLYTVNGDSASDYLGYSVSGAGDVNNDGYADFIAGAYGDDNSGADSGSARVYSGVDGSVLYTVDGDSYSDYLGYSVSGIGDLNNDGYADFIAGAYRDDNNGSNSGSARVYLSSDLMNDVDLDFIINSADADDDDGLLDVDEPGLGTDPLKADTDNDGFNDGEEVNTFGTNPLVADGDNDKDGLPNDYDTDDDNDGWTDTDELACIADPVDVNSFPIDTDGDTTCNYLDSDDDNDGMPDSWENTHGLNPLIDDSTENPDGDRFTNLDEYNNDTDPFVADISSATNDTDGDFDSDIIWRNSANGGYAIWEVQDKLKASGNGMPGLGLDYDLIATNDLDADGDFDWLLFRQDIGQAIVWVIEDHAKVAGFLAATFNGYTIRGLGDVDADGDADIVWQNETWGGVIIWIMEGGAKQSGAYIGTLGDGSVVEAVGDFDNDGDDDLMWSVPGAPSLIRWDMENGSKQAGTSIGGFNGYSITNIGDFNGDGTDDLIWEPDGGGSSAIIWLMQNGNKQTGMAVGTLAGFSIGTVGDYDADGDDDLLWYNPDLDPVEGLGGAVIWEIENGAKVSGNFVDTITSAAEVRP